MTSVEEISSGRSRKDLPNPGDGDGDGDDRSPLSSDDDPQAGVKNIEAISQTWTKLSLVFAYVGSVEFSC